MLKRAEIGTLLYALCRNAVEVQRRFDATWAADVTTMAAALSHRQLTAAADVVEGLGAALIPRRSVVRSFEIDFRVAVGTSRERGFAVTVAALNVGYDRRYTARHETQSRLHIHVEQVPTDPS